MEEYFVIGTIIGPHALKGEVKILSTTDFKAERYAKGNTLYIEKNNEKIQVQIKSYRAHKDFDLVCFENYNDINAVEPFSKCKVYVPHSQLEDLEEDEFYYHELIGCVAYSNETKLGIVKDIVNYGASDILIIEDETNKEIMIPFVDDFIEEVDLDAQKIMIHLVEGILGDQDKE
ncbi:MAG: rimM [Haloplasmataceae bacterium]|jgi:16S rRNA processing protein RimM|nr:rimM [Haloplasmataceae bacterium]